MLYNILKEYGMLYIEMDYPNNTHTEFVKGTVEDLQKVIDEYLSRTNQTDK